MRNFKRDGKTSGNSDLDFFVWKYALYKSYRIAPWPCLVEHITFELRVTVYLSCDSFMYSLSTQIVMIRGCEEVDCFANRTIILVHGQRNRHQGYKGLEFCTFSDLRQFVICQSVRIFCDIIKLSKFWIFLLFSKVLFHCLHTLTLTHWQTKKSVTSLVGAVGSR